jgi:homogentisate 1,2-dioxygenase
LRNYFYKNADADEMIFIHKGKLRTMMGNFWVWRLLDNSRGMIYQIDFDTEENRLFYVESFAPFYTQKI